MDFKNLFAKINEKNIFYQLTNSSLIEKDEITKTYLNKLEHKSPQSLKWHYTGQNDSIAVVFSQRMMKPTEINLQRHRLQICASKVIGFIS